MLAILREISVTCFTASYLVVLVLELLRVLGKIPGRGLAVVVMMSLGLFTHICYLVLKAMGPQGANHFGLLASWSDWALLLALGLAIAFFILYLRRPKTIVSFFFLPTILATIGLSIAVRSWLPFSRSEATDVWRSVHGLAMAVGSGAVLVGFLVGIMYIVQARRLKLKRAGSSLKLPTLETLARLNRQSLIVSTSAVAIGVVAGVVMNLNSLGSVGWTSSGILFSFTLLIWLIAACSYEFFGGRTSQGRKAIYLTLASLGFLVLAFLGVFYSSHGQSTTSGSVPTSINDESAEGLESQS